MWLSRPEVQYDDLTSRNSSCCGNFTPFCQKNGCEVRPSGNRNTTGSERLSSSAMPRGEAKGRCVSVIRSSSGGISFEEGAQNPKRGET